MSLFDSVADKLINQGRQLAKELETLPEAERIRALNEIRRSLHEASPFKAEPVDCVQWVPADKVQANDYNPNHVAAPEMRLLERSIAADGYTQHIVAYDEGDRYVIVDGFHRHRVGKESAKVRKRVRGYLPITVIRSDRSSLRLRSGSRRTTALSSRGSTSCSIRAAVVSSSRLSVRRCWSRTTLRSSEPCSSR